MATVDSDATLKQLGKYSRWQLISYFTICLGSSVPFAWMTMSVIFIGDYVDYRCAVAPNHTMEHSIPYTVDNVTGDVQYEKCVMYADPGSDNKSIVPCQYGYWYEPESGYESTLITEWDLVCGKEWLVELSMTIKAVGTVVSAIMWTCLADKYGRKKIWLICLWSNAVFALIQAFSPNIIFYTVLNFICGYLQQGLLNVGFILALELFPVEQRTFAGNAIEFVFVIGLMVLAAMAYGIRNWRHLQIVISAPTFISISFYWILSESIPWLVLNEKLGEASKVMNRAARINKITLPDSVFISSDLSDQSQDASDTTHSESEHVQNVTEEENANKDDPQMGSHHKKDGDDKYNILDVTKSRILCVYSLVLIFIWIVIVMGYYAISLTVTYLPGNRYLNYFMYSAIEIPSYVLMWIFTDRIGRRFSMVFFNVTGGVLLIATIIQHYGVDLDPLLITLSVVGKCMISGSYATIYLLTPEIYPTNVRNAALGVCVAFGQAASVISPFARTLHRNTPWLPNVIIGILLFMCGLLSLILPETRHQKLPTTIHEVEVWNAPMEKLHHIRKRNTNMVSDSSYVTKL